jgi:hypothetical protein
VSFQCGGEVARLVHDEAEVVLASAFEMTEPECSGQSERLPQYLVGVAEVGPRPSDQSQLIQGIGQAGWITQLPPHGDTFCQQFDRGRVIALIIGRIPGHTRLTGA